jgi:hypothetical protein
MGIKSSCFVGKDMFAHNIHLKLYAEYLKAFSFSVRIKTGRKLLEQLRTPNFSFRSSIIIIK